jgi:nucleoside-diphosphate-sugar epimerase
MRVVVIGGSGHIGTYLIPRLVEAGHEVINITRGQRQPYLPHAAWSHVRHEVADREGEEQAGTFARRIRDLKADVVMDMICFTEASVRSLVEVLSGEIQHFIHCGTIWTFGHSVSVPADEDAPKHPFGEYGIQKAAIERYLLDQARRCGFPATLLHPGHIVGRGWIPLNPQGNFNVAVYQTIARGEPLVLPNIGLETVHHVHADDVAQAFMLAMNNWSNAVGESFHTVSPAALTLRGYAEAVAAWFGKQANLTFMPWDTFRTTVSPEDAQATWDHIAHSPNASIAKAERVLGYHPRYTSLQGVFDSLEWLVEHGQIIVESA